LVVALLGWFGQAAEAGSCRPVESVSIETVQSASGLVLATASLAGRPVLVEIDSGAASSLLGADAAASLGLGRSRSPIPLLAGADGKPLSDYALVPSVALGPVRWGPTRFVVVPRFRALDSRAAGLLGADLLSWWDVELDLGHDRLALFRHADCAGELTPFAGFARSAMVSVAAGRVVVPVVLDGRRLRALIDTGASHTSLSLATARRLFGIEPGRPGVDPSPGTITSDGGSLATYRARFGRLDLAGQHLDQPEIDLIDRAANPHLAADHDLVLGLTELRRLRLYIAYRQSRLYAAAAD
jgi:predicted aspartyl protease